MKRILKAFLYSWQGLRATFQSEIAFRQDVLVCLIGWISLLFISISGAEKAILVLSLFLILLTELINTAIETIIDRISFEKNPLSQKAKDIGSSLVLMAFLNAFISWILILT